MLFRYGKGSHTNAILNSLRVLSVLCGFILLTAEHAEDAKIFCKGLRIKPYRNPLRALRALRGFILFNRQVCRARKGFSDSLHLGIKYQLLNRFHFFFAQAGHLHYFCDGIAELF